MRILVTSNYGYWGGFIPTDLGKDNVQIGGGETAMIKISEGLASLGHEVILFYDCSRPGSYNGVDWLPSELFPTMVCMLEHDVLVAWDFPYAFRFADRAKVHVHAYQLNDTFMGPFTHMVDLNIHPSQWHADRFHEMYPEIKVKSQRVRITNGIDTSRYAEPVEREAKRVIHSSSPDRGLHHLLRMWPSIQEKEPDATLHVFYDMEKWLATDKKIQNMGGRTVTSDRAEEIRRLVPELSKNPNVRFYGGVGQNLLAREQLKSGVMVYPCDPVAPTEGFSMSVLEALVAGSRVVLSNADAFPELWAGYETVTTLPLPIEDEVWVDAIVQALNEPAPKVNLELFEAKFSWQHLATTWEKELIQCLKKQQVGSSS